MKGNLDLLARMTIAAALLLGLFAVRWDSSLQHFDWQVWEASSHLLHEGANPYDADQLNAELQSKPDDYGPHFVEPRRMFLLNPPTWIVAVRAVAGSVLIMTFAGGVMFLGSIVALTRNRPIPEVTAYLFSAVLFPYLGPGLSTFRFGQTGLIVAGLVGVSLALDGRRVGGVPIALLSSKPHMAFALGVARLVRQPIRTVVTIGVPLAFLVVATTALLGAGVWSDWLTALIAGDAHPRLDFGDSSIRTLSPHLPFMNAGTIAVVAGAIVATWLAYRCRAGDPKVNTLASLAVVTYLSGHAFMHDWLWLPLVPVILKWDVYRTLGASFALGTAWTIWRDITLADVFVNPQSACALGVTCFLVWQALSRSSAAVDAPPGADREPEVVAAV